MGCSSTKPDDGGGRRPRKPARDKPPKEDNAVDEPYKDLKVEDIDLLIDENSKDHHTDTYDLTDSSAKLVLRRGAPFSVKIRFSRKVNLQEDNLRFALTAGDYPQHGDGSLVHFSLSERDPRGKWNAEKTEENENEVKVQITIPADCLVCKWRFKVEILEQKDGEPIVHVNKKIFPMEIYILFNPWNKADTVYLEDESLRKEYVLNDEGAIWVGNYTNFRTWFFGQFEMNVLDCTMYLLDNDDEPMKIRGNSVSVSRKLSAVGNDIHGGLLVGNWSGNYAGGKKPTDWRGSVRILTQYWKTKSPVRYGQCWVFSGITTTMCRAIGIPCRSVTNFSSAHDTDGSITIDRYFDLEGNKEGGDSTWNFHVWNEVWMRRPDISKANYDGWQAIDSTPQEESGGTYQCGPMPVAAIKEGDVSYNFDGPFIFAEVNADIVTWVNGRDGQPYFSDIDRVRVGKDISTRAPQEGKENKRQDLTDNYKYREGTEKEKEVVLTAFKAGHTYSGENYKLYKGFINSQEKNVEAKLDTPVDAKYGEDFTVSLTGINRSDKEQLLYCTVSLTPENSAAERLKRIKFRDMEGSIPPKGEDGKISLEVVVTVDEYIGRLHDGCFISVAGVIFNNTTKQASLIERSIMLVKPELKVEIIDDDVQLNKPFSIGMSFTNPLNVPLTQCEIDIDAKGIVIEDPKAMKRSNVGPKQEFSAEIPIKATKSGFFRVGAVFNSTEMYDVAGNTWLYIK